MPESAENNRDEIPGASSIDQDSLESVALIGDLFGIIFLNEPYSANSESIYSLLSSLDPEGTSANWPFASKEDAQELLARMKNSLVASEQDDLIWEYRRLFVGPARKAAPPWGSVYLDKDQVIFGISTLDLRQWMRQNGVGKTKDDEEPEDHIGRMLLMMSWLARYKPELLPEFLGDHLLTWAPRFFELVTEETENAFFAASAALCKASLEGMQVRFDIPVRTVKIYR